MANQHFGLNDDPFADAHELTVEEATRLLRGRISAAGGEGTRLFPDDTCVELHRLSSGRRGGLFALAGRAMKIAARAGAKCIETTHVQIAASEAGHDAARAVARVAEPPHSSPPVSDPDGAGVMLPSEPSPDLDAGAREWVGRFMAIPGPGNAPAPSREPAVREAKKPRAEEPPQPAAPQITPAEAKQKPPVTHAEPASGMEPPKPTASRITHAEAKQPPVVMPAESEASGAPIQPATQLSAATSARLREGPRSRTRRQRTIVQGTVGAVAVIALGVVVMNRLPGNVQAPAARPAATAAPVTPMLPPAAPAPSPAMRETRPSGPGSRASTRGAAPSPAQTGPATEVSPSPTDAESPDAVRVGLEVATYIFRERAEDERARLVAAGYRARVKTAWENGAPSYRVIVGPYRGWAAAERAADELLATGMVGQARAIKLD